MNSDFYNKTISHNLRKIRREKGLTTTELAKILGTSQAKISYIENSKGVLSARDVAILSRKLDVPVTEFFRGLDRLEEPSEQLEIAALLVHYGATHLAKPAKVTIQTAAFEEVFSKALAFIEDDRLHKAFCAALILQAAKKEIHFDRIFALTGNNPYLVQKISQEGSICLQIIEILNREKKLVGPRAKRQIERLISISDELQGGKKSKPLPSNAEVRELAHFVEKCLYAER